jgi:hypothetical protein
MGLRATERVDLAAACVGARPKDWFTACPRLRRALARDAVADVREGAAVFFPVF